MAHYKKDKAEYFDKTLPESKKDGLVPVIARFNKCRDRPGYMAVMYQDIASMKHPDEEFREGRICSDLTILKGKSAYVDAFVVDKLKELGTCTVVPAYTDSHGAHQEAVYGSFKAKLMKKPQAKLKPEDYGPMYNVDVKSMCKNSFVTRDMARAEAPYADYKERFDAQMKNVNIIKDTDIEMKAAGRNAAQAAAPQVDAPESEQVPIEAYDLEPTVNEPAPVSTSPEPEPF